MFCNVLRIHNYNYNCTYIIDVYKFDKRMLFFFFYMTSVLFYFCVLYSTANSALPAFAIIDINLPIDWCNVLHTYSTVSALEYNSKCTVSN